ncbi:MAG: sulfotransferase [Woeseiaceae bacterium]|nr:sulfotransferase [Woeseiaceae bacterium]
MAKRNPGPAEPAEKIENIRRALDFLRHNRPLRAEETCRDWLLEHPGSTDHMRVLALALLKQKRHDEAEDELRFALSLEPEFPQLHEDLGSVLAAKGNYDDAIPAFEKALELQPALPLARKKLGQALTAAGRDEEAVSVFREYVEDDPERAEIIRGIELQHDGKADEAIDVFRTVLRKNPDSVNAMRQLALVLWNVKNRHDDAEALLRRATQQAPDFTNAWLSLGALLMAMNRYVDSIEAFRKAVALNPDNAQGWAGLGNAYGRAMYPEQAIEAYKHALELDDQTPGVLASYAWEQKTVGNQDEALQAYRRAVEVKPSFGQAYWSMANLKIFKFEEREVEAMLEQVERDDLEEVEDIHFRFALGKAMEDKGDYDRAWHFYHTGNQRQRQTVEYDPLEFEKRMTLIKSVFDAELLEMRAGAGFDAPDPIFIVGLPRSGSTLIEQILASHSRVEGTAELPVMGRITESIGRYRTDEVRYPEAVRDLRDKDLRAYGRQYIREARRYRGTDKPFFTDKLPNNFPMLGFASLVLPNAKFINARRHPFDSCLGAYKQLFGSGQNFTYDMLDLAHYYQQYDAMIRHWHAVMPDRILDVHYEETVLDLEGQVRRILEHCGLPFEQSCVRYWETDRAVKTASSEQVRQPIYTSALGKWRRYEPHLDLWKEQLGYIVDELPDTVKNAGA